MIAADPALYKKILRRVLRKVRRLEIAEEILQTACVQLLSKKDSKIEEGHLFDLITKNLTKQYLTGDRRASDRYELLFENYEDLAEKQEQPSEMDEVIFVKQIEDWCIDHLPLREATAILYRINNGGKTEEHLSKENYIGTSYNCYKIHTMNARRKIIKSGILK